MDIDTLKSEWEKQQHQSKSNNKLFEDMEEEIDVVGGEYPEDDHSDYEEDTNPPPSDERLLAFSSNDQQSVQRIVNPFSIENLLKRDKPETEVRPSEDLSYHSVIKSKLINEIRTITNTNDPDN